MRNLPSLAVTAMATIALASPLAAAQRTGAIAQDFKLTDINGKTVQLSQFRGKTVVLEWHNPGCPFVAKHYNSGNMQMTQKAARQQGAVWLTINSGAKGKQGHMTGAEAKSLIAKQNIQSSNYLFDTKGLVGKAYGAKT
ncbi:MAG: redoxin domain-containing protein, partial [Parasphingorhabdus sp.]